MSPRITRIEIKFLFIALFIAHCSLLIGCNPWATNILPPRYQAGAEVTQPFVVGLPDPESITVGEVTLITETSQVIEYAVSTEAEADPDALSWQSLTTFHGLSSGTAYYVYARSKQNGNYNAGDASVSELIRFYTVSFDSNGADGGEAPGPQTVLEETVISIPDWGFHTPHALWRLGSAFGSWNTLANGTGTDYIPGRLYTVTHNQTMYVRWLDAQTYRLPYNAPTGGGEIDSGIYISQTTDSFHPFTGRQLPFYAEIYADPEYLNPKWFYGLTQLDNYVTNGGYTLTVDARNVLYNVLGLHVVRLEADKEVIENGVPVIKPFTFNISFMVER